MRHLGSQEVRLYPLEPRTVDGTGRNLDEIHIYIQPPPGVTKLGATDLEFQCPPVATWILEWGLSQYGCFTMRNPTQMDDLGLQMVEFDRNP